MSGLPALRSMFKSAYKPGFSPAELRKEANMLAALTRRYELQQARRQLAFPRKPLPGVTATGLFNARARGQEKKFIDTNVVYNAWNVNRSYIVLLNGVATGTDYNTRIGREVTMKSYYLRMFITDATNIQQVRCMLVYDKQPAGVLPAITDILQYNNANSPNNLNNRDRFVIVSDKVYTTSPQGTEIRFVKKYKKLRTVTTYNNTGNGIADIATGALYFVAVAFNNVATTTLDGYARVRFVDN